MKYLLEKKETNQISTETFNRFSLYPFRNKLWEFKNFDVFQQPICIMHQADHGIGKRIIEMVQDFINNIPQHKNHYLNEFDRRFAAMEHFPRLKIFRVGIFELSNPTASEHRTITLCLPFILHGLHHAVEPYLLLSINYLKWRYMLDNPKPTDEDLKKLDQQGAILFEHLFRVSDLSVSAKIVSMPKVITNIYYLYVLHLFY